MFIREIAIKMDDLIFSYDLIFQSSIRYGGLE